MAASGKRWRLAVVLALLVLLGPVACQQLFPGEQRVYAGVTLDQVSYEEVEFRNSVQRLDLAGMLFMPDDDGSFPAAVISGTGIIGMSQGGWIAPIVARDDQDVSFLVNMVGSSVTPNEQLLFEEDHNIRHMGVLPGISCVIAIVSSAHIRHVRMPEFYDAVGDYDPVPLWDQLDIDVLALYGRDDTNVPSAESAARLNALARDNIEVRVFDSSGHALQDPPGQGDDLIRQEALTVISDFIREVAAEAAPTGSELD